MVELRYPTLAHARLGRNRVTSHNISHTQESSLVETLFLPSIFSFYESFNKRKWMITDFYLNLIDQSPQFFDKKEA
jgi:hypothetical protein